jgi:hypothetical protein
VATQDERPPPTELEEKSIPELLAEETGEPAEKFDFDEDEYEIPELDELEVLDPDQVYD